MSSGHARFSAAYVSVVLLLLLAQHAPTAAGIQHTPLRHGTLLLGYVTDS
jgi:hypothetical protein